MSISERIHKLRRLADLKQMELGQAAEILQQLQLHLSQQQQQYDRLYQYLSEYLEERDLTQIQHVQPSVLALRGGFIKQLKESVAIQASALEHAQSQFDIAKKRWFELKKMHEKIQEQVQQCLQMRQQTLDKSDEAHVQEFFVYRSRTLDS